MLINALLLVIRKEVLGKKLSQTWPTTQFVRTLATTKKKPWSSSCSLSAIVPKGTALMEHAPDEFKAPDNPLGVGPYFGYTQSGDLNNSNELDVLWCDQQRIKIAQIYTWLCPPVNKDKPVRVKDPNTGQTLLLFILGYTQRGVKLLVQEVGRKIEIATRKSSTQVAKATSEIPEAITAQKSPRRSPRKSVVQKRRPSATAVMAKKKKRTVASRKKATPPKRDGHSSDEPEPPSADMNWNRFRRAPLSTEQRRLLDEQVVIREQEIISTNFDKNQWHCFVDRAAREYVYLHSKLHREDHMHLHREPVLASALATVLSQVKPKNALPMNGDLDEIIEAVQPMLEIALSLSGPKSKEKTASQAWIHDKIKSGDYSVQDCDAHPELMADFVKKKIAECVKKGSPDGYFVMEEGDEVPSTGTTYKLCATRVGKRRATASDVLCKQMLYYNGTVTVEQLRWNSYGGTVTVCAGTDTVEQLQCALEQLQRNSHSGTVRIMCAGTVTSLCKCCSSACNPMMCDIADGVAHYQIPEGWWSCLRDTQNA